MNQPVPIKDRSFQQLAAESFNKRGVKGGDREGRGF
jgi:hypothetical protein